MARVYQPNQPQQVFEEAPEPVLNAQALESTEKQFRTAVSDRLKSQYGTLADQYEKKQITDQDFAHTVELLVSRIEEPAIQQEWQPIVTETNYVVFKNAQSITASQIEIAMTTGTMTPQDGVKKYTSLAQAALKFNTQTSVQDAMAWQLKASVLTAALKSKGRGSQRSSDTDELSEIRRKFELGSFQLDHEKQVFNNNLDTIQIYLDQGQITPEQATTLRQESLSQYSYEVSLFGLDSEIMKYISDVDPIGGYSYLNEQISYVQEIGGQTPTYYSGFKEGLDALPQEPEEPGAFQKIQDKIQDVISGKIPPEVNVQSAQPQPQAPPAAPTPAPQTQRLANPLGIGLGGSMRGIGG